MNETVEFMGSKHEVIKRYQLTDEYMAEHQLFYKNRIKLRNLETGEIRDFANTTNI